MLRLPSISHLRYVLTPPPRLLPHQHPVEVDKGNAGPCPHCCRHVACAQAMRRCRVRDVNISTILPAKKVLRSRWCWWEAAHHARYQDHGRATKEKALWKTARTMTGKKVGKVVRSSPSLANRRINLPRKTRKVGSWRLLVPKRRANYQKNRRRHAISFLFWSKCLSC